MGEQSTLEIFREIAEPLLRQFLFLSSLVLLAIGRVTEGALAYLFFFALNWARNATRATRARKVSRVRPEILASLVRGRGQVLLGRSARALALAGIFFWLYEVPVPVVWCVVPALLAAFDVDTAFRARDLAREVILISKQRSSRMPVAVLFWSGMVLAVVNDLPAVLLNLFIAIPSLDFLRRH